MRYFTGICAAVIALGVGPATPTAFGRPLRLVLPHVSSPADLVSNHVLSVIALLPSLPPAPDLPVMQQAGVHLFDEKTMPRELISALDQVERGSVTLYEVYVIEDEITRDRILLRGDGLVLWSVAAPPGTDPTAAAHAYWPWLVERAEDDPERLWYEAVYDPARVISRCLLLPQASLDDYAEALAVEWAQAAASGAGMRSLSLDPDAFLVTGLSRTNDTSVTLALQLPPDFTNRVDLFGIESLADFPWQLTVTTPPVTSRTAEVTLAWPYDSGFFCAGDADTDSDGDGIPDAREARMYGTDPDDADSDGDGLPDGWEIAYGFDPFVADALSDPDGDRVPTIYEYHHGTNPTNSDSHLITKLRVDPAAATTNATFFASIKAAFAASVPYAVIEVADGTYTGQNNTGLWFPPHPVLLMSENWGASRLATVSYDGDLAAFYMNARQDNRTIVRGLNLLLGGKNFYQIGFWLGDGGLVAPDKGAAPFFEGVSVELGTSDVNVGFLCRHSASGVVRFDNCVIRGKRGSFKPMRGIYAIDSPTLLLANCTFQDFSPQPYSYGIQFESTPYNGGSADNPINASLVNCVWDESFDHPDVEAFVRLEQSVVYRVSLTNCLVPRALGWFPPDACANLIVSNANLSIGGHIRGGSPTINAGFAVAPRLDFEGQARDATPDIGADEYAAFAAGDSDSDGLFDAIEVEVYGTNPYAADSDGDGLDDGMEVALGSDPTNPFNFRVTVLGSVTNRSGATAPLAACYGWHEGLWDPATATNVAGNGSFELDVFATAAYSGAWVNVFCDFNTNGIVDAATEPVYSQVVIVTGICHRMHFDLRDWDGDGVPDWDEVRYETDPCNATNYCVTVLGLVTNTIFLTANLRLGCSLTADGAAMLVDTNATSASEFELPQVTINSAEPLRVHLYDDVNSNAVLDAGEAFITQTPPITGAVIEVVFNISLATCDTDGDGMLDFWEARHGLSWTNAADACGNLDGDGLINLHEYWCQTDPQSIDGAQYALSAAALVIDSRIVGRNPTNALPLFDNYLANGANGVFIRNTNCWAADLDLTCCSPWNSNARNKKAGTLISPRHVLFVVHSYYTPPVGTTLYFIGKTNNIITRTLVTTIQHPACPLPPYGTYPDIAIGLLDSDVPTNIISFAKVLPDNYATYLRNGNRLPAICFDQEEKARILDIFHVEIMSGTRLESIAYSPLDGARLNLYEAFMPGDSGNPCLIFLRETPVLLTVWTAGIYAGSGTSVTAFKADINQLMFELGGNYQLTEIDLSDFTPLP